MFMFPEYDKSCTNVRIRITCSVQMGANNTTQANAKEEENGQPLRSSLYLSLIWEYRSFVLSPCLRHDYYRESLLLNVENTALNMQ